MSREINNYLENLNRSTKVITTIDAPAIEEPTVEAGVRKKST